MIERIFSIPAVLVLDEAKATWAVCIVVLGKVDVSDLSKALKFRAHVLGPGINWYVANQ